MDKIEKLLRKISSKQREKLLLLIELLLEGKNSGLNIKKLKGSDLYRLRHGRFRIIFHCENKDIVIDAIKIRNEGTYK